MGGDEHGWAAEHATNVDLRGLMAVLSEHLYSTSDVVVRELVQNAHDSIARRRLTDSGAPPGRIDVCTDPRRLVLEVADDGSGLTYDEVHLYLATVGRGATGTLRRETGSDELIGMFGLGFLSAFVVSDEVVVTTTSASTPHETWQYRSTDGHRYALTRAAPQPVGTTVRLALDATHADLAAPEMVGALLRRYCRLLGVPIHLDGGDAINVRPPWRDGATSAGTDRALAFAREIETRFEPVAAIPIGAQDGWLRGMLWIHGGSTYGNADNRRMSVAVRGMLLTDDDADLLPRWAGFVSGVVESTELSPTASREALRHDTAYAEAQLIVSEALVTGLAELARSEPVVWARIVDRHGEALRGAAITDERLFDLVAEVVPVPTSQGDRRIGQLVVGRQLYVSLGAERGFEEVVFRAQGVPIARGDRYGVLPLLRQFADRHDLVLVEIGTDEGNAIVFDAEPLDESVTQWLATELADDDEVVVGARFAPRSLPLAVIPDREAELRDRLRRDDLRASSGDGPFALARLHADEIGERPPTRVYVNLDCPTVVRLIDARERDPASALRGLTILRTIKTVMAASDRNRGGERDLVEAFDSVLAVIDGMLLGSTGPEGTAR